METATPTLQDFVKIQMQVDKRNRNGADALFSHVWAEKSHLFLSFFCGEQGVGIEDWQDLPGSTVLSGRTLQLFLGLKDWLREQSDQFAGI